jgi:ATP-dependent DNA ligase
VTEPARGRSCRGSSPRASPSKIDKLPSGREWLQEIKHGIARKIGPQVKLCSRPGNVTYRFPLIVESVARLRSRSCIIDGEAVA